VATGAYAINPVTIKRSCLDIRLYPHVLRHRGIMAVPGHDERDFAFAKKFNIPVIQVVSADGSFRELTEAFTEEGVAVNSGNLTACRLMNSRKKSSNGFPKMERAQGRQLQLRDWIFSRQRYWESPFRSCTATSAASSCPVCRASIDPAGSEKLCPTGTGEPPLAASLIGSIPSVQMQGQSEEGDQHNAAVAGSCWYYLRYLDPKKRQGIRLA